MNLLFPYENNEPVYTIPDYEYVYREMAKSSVTLTLLWLEYCDKCRDNQEMPYQFTQFQKYYSDFVVKTKATMHINRKSGEIMKVDWAGQTESIIDTDTSEIIPAYVFLAVLSYSDYTYVEAFSSQNQESWMTAHVNAYTYFQGVTCILVPDNLKTGVDIISTWILASIRNQQFLSFKELNDISTNNSDEAFSSMSFEERFGLLVDSE